MVPLRILEDKEATVASSTTTTVSASTASGLRPPAASSIIVYILGVKVRIMKVDFKTGGNWHRVGQ